MKNWIQPLENLDPTIENPGSNLWKKSRAKNLSTLPLSEFGM
jgi:hypothetical protein